MIQITPIASSSRGNCYHVTDGSTPILLECGVRFSELERRLDFNLSDIGACLISHEHQDHCRAVEDLMRYGVGCYMSYGTAKALGILTHHRTRIVENERLFTYLTWAIKPFKTQHDAAQPLGYLLKNAQGEKLLYITDSYYCHYTFTGLTHIMVECNHSLELVKKNKALGLITSAQEKRLLRSHFSLENVINFLRANDMSKVQEIWLIHLSDDNSNADHFQREIQKVTGRPVYIAQA